MNCKPKANRSRIHKSNWRCIKVIGEMDFQLDDTGRLIDKFPKHKPRKYLSDLKIYQNEVPNENNPAEPLPEQDLNSADIFFDSYTNEPGYQQEFDIGGFNDFVDDQDPSDFYFEIDDQVISLSL